MANIGISHQMSKNLLDWCHHILRFGRCMMVETFSSAFVFSVRCNIMLMLRCQCQSVCPSVCDVCALWSQGAMDPGYLCMFG